MAGSFAPFGQNIRRYEVGQVGPRPPVGDPLFTASPGSVNSLRRLNDSTPLGPAAGYSVVYDIGSEVFVGPSRAAVGFSTNRKTYASFRPDASVQPWMYVGDSVRGVKVNANGAAYDTGIAEPQYVAIPEIAENQFAVAWAGDQSDVANAGTAGPVVNTLPGPPNFSIPILGVAWDFGDQGPGSVALNNTGGVLVNMIVSDTDFLIALVQKILASPANATLDVPQYDSPGNGPVVFELNSLVTLTAGQIYVLDAGGPNEEYVNVQKTWDIGSSTFFRSYATKAHVAGETATGKIGIRVLAPEGFTGSSIFPINSKTTITAGTGSVTASNNSAQMQGRFIQDTDVVHFFVQVDVPGNITACSVTFNIDPTTKDFTANAMRWNISPVAFTSPTLLDLSIAVGSLTRIGTDINLSLASGIHGIKISFTVSGTTVVIFGGITVIGNYGANGTGSNAPVSYRYTWRSTETGARSNPSPPMRTGLTPNNQGIWLWPDSVLVPDIQATVLDWYRLGGTLLNYTYVGTANIIDGVIEPFLDDNDDLTVANSPLLEFDNFEPFPSIDVPYTNTVSVKNFIVTPDVNTFDPRWLPGTQININGKTYTLYKRPTSLSQLEILEDGGFQGQVNGVPMTISRPIIAAQRLPALWGPTDNTGFFFAVGDPLRPGTLYFTKGNNPDSAPDTNQIEVTSPSEPLMNGVIMNGLAMVFSTERAWWIYPQFANVLATVIGTIGSPFYLIETISNRGLYAKNGICTDGGGRVFFVSKDGIYESAGGPGKCITDSIYTMFPHEGGPQVGMPINGDILDPPDYTNPDSMALAFVDDRLYFDYVSRGIPRTMVYDVMTGMWSQDTLGITGAFTAHAPNEGGAIGTLVGILGTPHATIRTFVAFSTEPIQMVAQPDFQEYQSPAWQHVKELNAEYQLPTGTANLQFIPDQGIAIPSIAVPTAANQIKSLLIAPAPNKFKLLQFILVANDPQFRMWTDGWEVKLGAWGRDTPYQVVKPFLRFGINVASE